MLQNIQVIMIYTSGACETLIQILAKGLGISKYRLDQLVRGPQGIIMMIIDVKGWSQCLKGFYRGK